MSETTTPAPDTRADHEAWRSMTDRTSSHHAWVNDDQTLSHDEIDRLMGLDTAATAVQGTEALAYAASSPHALYHALRPTGERIASLLERELRNAFSTLVDVTFTEFGYARLGVILTDMPIPSLLARFRIENGLPTAFATVDAALATLYFDCIMGGVNARPSVMPGGRAFSTVECRLFENFGRMAATALSEGFAAKIKSPLQFDLVETHPRNLALGKSATPSLRIRYQVKVGQRVGLADVYLTGSFLESVEKEYMPVRAALGAPPDPSWRAKLVAIAAKAEVELEVVLREIELPLSRITALKLEDTIPLKMTPSSPVSIRAGGKKIASAIMGRANNHIAVRVLELVSNSASLQEEQ